MNGQRNLRTILFVAVGAVMTALAVAAYLTHFSRPLENSTVDARFKIRGTQKPPAEIVVIDIDDKTFDDLRTQWPFPRRFHAQLTDRLRRDGAKLIVFDIQFTEPSRYDDANNSDTGALVLACRAARTCLFSDTEPGPKGQSRVFGGPDGVDYARAKVGDGRFPQDSGNVIRRMAYTLPGTRLPTLAIQAERELTGGKFKPAAHGGKPRWIDFYGPAGTFKVVSYSEACNCVRKAHIKQVPADFFKNKIAIVGSSSSVLQDVHATSTDSLMGGPEIQANALQTVRRNFPFTDSPEWLDLLLIVLMGAIPPLFGLRLKLWALAVAAVAGVLYTIGTQVAFDQGEVLSFIYPMGALVLSSAGSLGVHYVTEAYERERVRGMFSRFVPESVVGEVLAQADGARLGGVAREATVMFSDIRGFTSFAEQIEPDQVIRILNRYLTAMVDDAIIPNGGTLVDYMGDGIMAVFGAPIEMPDHADRALAGARAKLRELDKFNEWMKAEYDFEKLFRIGIGLNSGRVMSGNVGSERRLAYTTIGDTTNTAARLEGMTKGTDLMLFMSESTKNALSTVPEDLIFVGEYEIRGRVEKISIYSLEESRKRKRGESFASVVHGVTLPDK
jgi:adenylate cyclase